MDAIDVVRRLHEHRAWVNARLLDAADALADEALRRPMAIGQGSVWKSLVHLYAAEYTWLEALGGNEQPVVPGDLPTKLPGNQEAGGGVASLAELRRLWATLEDRWRAYLQSLSPADLETLVAKRTTSGQRLATRRVDILLHVCTHAHYTTAQVVNMLRQLEAKLPDTMLITMARQEQAAG